MGKLGVLKILALKAEWTTPLMLGSYPCNHQLTSLLRMY